jgi:hypothetical protein
MMRNVMRDIRAKNAPIARKSNIPPRKTGGLRADTPPAAKPAASLSDVQSRIQALKSSMKKNRSDSFAARRKRRAAAAANVLK